MTAGPDQFRTSAGNTVSGVVMEHIDNSGNSVGDSAANPHPVTDAVVEAALGTPSDVSWIGSGTATVIAALKALWAKLGVPETITITQTVVAVTSADAVILAANPARQYFAVVNIGTGLVSLAFGTAAVAGQGWPLAAALSAGDQGGGLSSDPGLITTQAIHAISAAGSTVVVHEGVSP